MQRLHNPNLVDNAKRLRKNQTKEEKKLWFCFLRSLPVKFTRQKVIGCYIADFYCHERNIVIELDGSQHFEAEGERKDAKRDAYLEGLGLKVLHYSNWDIAKNFQAVCNDILKNLALE